MKSLTQLFFVALLCFSSIFSVSAQNRKDVEKLILESIEVRRNGNQIEEMGIVLDQFSNDALINITTITLDEKKSKSVLNKNDFKALYETMYKENISRKYDVKFHSIKVQKNVAIAVFSLNYTLINNNTSKVLSKGTEYMTSTMIAKEGTWKILELNITDIEIEKYQGKCSCEILKNDKTGGVVAKVIAPKGDRFQKDINAVYRKKVKDKDFLMVQGVKFEWTHDLEVYLLDKDFKRIKKMGISKTYDDVVKTMINYLYQNECSDLDTI